MPDFPDPVPSFPREPVLPRSRAQAVILILVEAGYGLVIVLGGAGLAGLVYGLCGGLLGVPFGLTAMVAAGLLLALFGLAGGLARGLIRLGRSLRRTLPVVTRRETV